MWRNTALFFCFLLSLSLPVAAQSQRFLPISEAELSRLEQLSAELKTLSQEQSKQVATLQSSLTGQRTRMTELLSKSETLQEQLAQAESSLATSRKLYAGYVREASSIIEKSRDNAAALRVWRAIAIALALFIVAGVVIKIVLLRLGIK